MHKDLCRVLLKIKCLGPKILMFVNGGPENRFEYIFYRGSTDLDSGHHFFFVLFFPV